MVAVPLLLLVRLTPVGNVPVALMFIDAPVGKPVVVTVNVWPTFPGWNVVLLALVMDGGWFTAIVIVAAVDVSAAAQLALGAPQLSGLPRSVTVNWKLSGPT